MSSPLDHMKHFNKMEEARLQCLASAINIGFIGDNEAERTAHEAGWHAAIVHMSMTGQLKEETEYDQRIW